MIEVGWVRVSDDFYDHKKFHDVGPLSLALWISGLAYCNRNFTDGILTESVASRLCDFDGLAYTVATVGDLGGVMESDCYPLAMYTLIEAGLWHDDCHDCPECPQPGRKKLYVHDYLKYQLSATEIADRREKRKAAGRKGAEVRWGADGDD